MFPYPGQDMEVRMNIGSGGRTRVLWAYYRSSGDNTQPWVINLELLLSYR